NLCSAIRKLASFLKISKSHILLRGGRWGIRANTSCALPPPATEAVAVAGGFTDASKHSQVVLFRRVSTRVVETHVLNLKSMLASRNLEEDPEFAPVLRDISRQIHPAGRAV